MYFGGVAEAKNNVQLQKEIFYFYFYKIVVLTLAAIVR
jgi:hypothetical protein